MLTTKYHLGSIIAIFLALGIGILIGGTLGQQWINRTEDQLVKRLEEKYEHFEGQRKTFLLGVCV